jgi:hypothetical protein
MNRYQPIPIINTIEDPKLRYVNSKYPSISLDSTDIYVYTTQGDRYDVLAQTYYGDSSYWWVINRANPSQDAGSLFPAIGAQIRIPAFERLFNIISQYEALNLNI